GDDGNGFIKDAEDGKLGGDDAVASTGEDSTAGALSATGEVPEDGSAEPGEAEDIGAEDTVGFGDGGAGCVLWATIVGIDNGEAGAVAALVKGVGVANTEAG
ncbi:hypothetical protein LTR04_004070, partial [Oleoguttula sp. CCFEE 6159]